MVNLEQLILYCYFYWFLWDYSYLKRNNIKEINLRKFLHIFAFFCSQKMGGGRKKTLKREENRLGKGRSTQLKWIDEGVCRWRYKICKGSLVDKRHWLMLPGSVKEGRDMGDHKKKIDCWKKWPQLGYIWLHNFF